MDDESYTFTTSLKQVLEVTSWRERNLYKRLYVIGGSIPIKVKYILVVTMAKVTSLHLFNPHIHAHHDNWRLTDE